VGNILAQPFENLWTKPGSGPSLVLNTTSTTGGDRIPISDLSMRDWSFTSRGPCKVNIAEHLRLPLSAAANASARFPLIEDWGSFEVNRVDADTEANCKSHEAVADGGFFDNYGATTVYDALNALELLKQKKMEVIEKRQASGEELSDLIELFRGTPLHFIVIQITSDPDCRLAEALDDDSHTAVQCKKQLRQLLATKPLGLFSAIGVVYGSLLHPLNYVEYWHQGLVSLRERLLLPDVHPQEPGPLGVLMNARTVSGFNAALALRCKVKEMKGSYYYFSMAGAFDNPLGWSLSLSARDQLNRMLVDGSNANAMEAFVRELKGGPPHVPKSCD
jgi:hypothetical protein